MAGRQWPGRDQSAVHEGSIVLAEPVGLGLLVGFGLMLVSLALVHGIAPSSPLPIIRRAAGGVRAAGDAA
jgi:hypothetical protein